MTENVTNLPASSDHPTCEPSGRRLWLMIAGLGVVAAVVLFFKLGDFRSFGTHETYAVVPAREMLESGDWIVPRSGGLPRLRKPPLSYWVVAGSVSLFGEMNEWTVRVPAAVSSLLLATLIGIWAGRWYGRTAGLGAALVQLTSAWVIIYARKAEVDMRVPDAETAKRIVAEVGGFRPFDPDCELEIEGGINRPPYEKFEGIQKLFDHAKELAAEVGFELEDLKTGGGSDGNFTAALGIPTLDGLGADGHGAHSFDEHIYYSSLIPRTQLMIRLFETLK